MASTKLMVSALKKLMENMDSKEKAKVLKTIGSIPAADKSKPPRLLKKKASGGTVKRMGGGMTKKTKYRSKGGTVKRMGGGKAKNTKYRSKGGVVKRRSGGRAGKR